jgi:phospholipase/carboxylesterase
MKTIATTLVHRVSPPDAGVGDTYPALILLHGRGTDEDDLMGLSRFLDDRLLLLAARAPFPYEFGGYTWYDADEIGQPDRVKFPESCGRLSTFVDDVMRGYPVDPARVFVLGFSMGAVMSFALSFARPGVFRGVSANSGYIPEGTSLALRWDQLGKTEFFIAHGTEDPVIPITMGRRAQTLFARSGASFVYREYPIGHQISEEGLADIAAWMAPLL